MFHVLKNVFLLYSVPNFGEVGQVLKKYFLCAKYFVACICHIPTIKEICLVLPYCNTRTYVCQLRFLFPNGCVLCRHLPKPCDFLLDLVNDNIHFLFCIGMTDR